LVDARFTARFAGGAKNAENAFFLNRRERRRFKKAARSAGYPNLLSKAARCFSVAGLSPATEKS
jgi:hypothetical protein